MKTERYDIEAGKNILNMLKQVSPADHAALMAQLKTRAGMHGMGASATEEKQPGFWEKLFAAGTGALTTVIDYKLQEKQAREQQKQYEAAAAVEMERQAMLAAQRQTQVLEYTNQMELQRQQQALLDSAERSKSTMNRAFIGVGALVGLWILYRVTQ